MSNRKIKVVVEQLIKHTPEDNNLYDELKKFKKDLLYKAPEILEISHNWIILQNILQNYLGLEYPTHGWQKKIIDIYTNK